MTHNTVMIIRMQILTEVPEDESYALYVVEETLPPFPVQLVWWNFPGESASSYV